MAELIAIHRDAFSTAPHVYRIDSGRTLGEMAQRIVSLPVGWPRHDGDVITVDGHVVPRGVWHLMRVKPDSVTEITFYAPPMGSGGGDGGKQIVSLIASIGLIALSGWIGTGKILGGFTGAAAAGRATVLSRLLGTAVLLAGNAVLSAIAPTPSVPTQDAVKKALGSASVQGNVLEPNAPLPRVIGTRKIFPPFVTEPLVYFSGDDEIVEAVYALAGPHKMEDIRVGAARVEDTRGVEIETREGWPGLAPLTLLTRYGRTTTDGTTIRGHTVQDAAKTFLESDTGDIMDAIPQAKVVSTRDGPDEFWMGFQFPQGLSRTGSESELNDPMRVAFRMRLRKHGETTWINLPEVHFKSSGIGARRITVKLIWRNGSADASAASFAGWVEARVQSPGQTIEPATGAWLADGYFDLNTGGDKYIDASNAPTTDVINVIMSDDTASFLLDKAVFSPGIYEVEIKRGYAFRDVLYTSADYTIASVVRDTFFYEGGGAEKIYQTKKNLVDNVMLVRSSSVWNKPPVWVGGVALVAVRARNVNLERLSVLASGYVKDWDGTGWSEWVTTDNPAPHLRDIFTGSLNATPLPEQVIDEQSLLDFRAAGWSCNAIMEGRSVQEAAQIVVGTGFAQFRQSETFGVSQDHDRSAESPVQIFTPHNSSDFSWARGYPKTPDGFRATFVDRDKDYEVVQIIHPIGAERTEQVSIEGLVTEDAVRARLQYDLDTARYRSVFYTWAAAAESIKAKRGSLVGVMSDVLTSRASSGTVTDYILQSDGKVASIRMDNEPELPSDLAWAAITDLSIVADVSLIGAAYGLALRRKGNVASTHAVTASALGPEWLDLATPATLEGLDYGDLALTGALGKEYRRVIVIGMNPRSLTDWDITAVAEGPQIWQ